MGAIRDLVNELRRRGLTVHEWSGWDGRGNEGVSQIQPKGAIIHHTATAYGSAFPGLVSSTRPGMIGKTLCNFSGNSDGSLTVIASGIGWHAGAGVGPSLGKLHPYRSRLNYYSVGLEIVYPGDRPMTDAQYRSALVFSKTVADMFGGGDIESVRAHAETNGNVPGGDGKWDPGYAPGRTINMADFRAAANRLTKQPGGFLMALDANQQQQIYDAVAATYVARGETIGAAVAKSADGVERVVRFLDELEESTGHTAAGVFTQVWEVLGANYAASGEAIGKTTSDIEAKVDKLLAAVTKLQEDIDRQAQA